MVVHAYHGDVDAIRRLLDKGESLTALGDNFDLNGAAFHGHAMLCRFLLDHGADPNHALLDTGETPLHAALCKRESVAHAAVVKVLLAAAADPNRRTTPGVPTGCFMRDVRTRGETPLHRAAAFASEDVIRALIDVGAALDAKDANGDTPLSWASWHLRAVPILRLLSYGPFHIHPDAR
jgi:ankyrin repeat protein